MIYSLYVLNATGYYLLFAVGKVRTNVIINLVSGVLALMLIAVGARQFGLIGAVVGNAGYALSLLFVYAGFRVVSVPLRAWLTWLAVPLAWYITVVAVNTAIGDNQRLMLVLYLVQALVFVYWFGYTQRAVIVPLVKAFQLRAHTE